MTLCTPNFFFSNPDGVTEDFFQLGGCDAVPVGSLCTCKENVIGRICDICKPLFWNLKKFNPQGCEDCNCHRPGTIGALGVCDQMDGQCACKPNVLVQEGERVCDKCKDGFFGLDADNGLGCSQCQCDPGGTDVPAGEDAICDKDSGQCTCKPGMEGRRCNEVMRTFYVPMVHQFQYEIEDGYRRDGSNVVIGYKEEDFPQYSWRGYGVYSKLQDEVLQDMEVKKQSVYNMVFRYINPYPVPVLGTVTVEDEAGTNSITHSVLLQPTGGQPAFMTVSGDKGIFKSPFDLAEGKHTTSVNIPIDAHPEGETEELKIVSLFLL